MAGFRSITEKCLVAKKILGNWEMNNQTFPKRQLVLVQEDNVFTLNCTEDVLNGVLEFETYSFVTETDMTSKKVRVIGVYEN